MKVFVTGASGFIGSVVVKELLANGHQVLGLVRSEAAAAALTATGAEPLRGSLDELETLRHGAEATDGVIHTAFIHDFSNFAASTEADKRAIETMGAVLAGSNRPLVVASGTPSLEPGRLATEEDPIGENFPRFSEKTALSLVSSGVRSSVMRLPPSVHGEGDHGFVATLINIARTKGVSAYPGDGSTRWSGVHRLDAARLFRLALENAPAGTRLHGVADESVPVRDIAEVIGRRLNVPVVSVPLSEAGEHFGWIAPFFSMDRAASSTLTQQRFGWHPTEPGLLEDIDHDYYFNNEE